MKRASGQACIHKIYTAFSGRVKSETEIVKSVEIIANCKTISANMTKQKSGQKSAYKLSEKCVKSVDTIIHSNIIKVQKGTREPRRGDPGIEDHESVNPRKRIESRVEDRTGWRSPDLGPDVRKVILNISSMNLKENPSQW